MMTLWAQKDMLMCFEIKMNTPPPPLLFTPPHVVAAGNLSFLEEKITEKMACYCQENA